MIKIAFAIPTYNRIEQLKKALKSIEQQNIPKYTEIYCVISNSCSDDGTKEFLDTLVDGKIKYIISNQLSAEYIKGKENFKRVVSQVPKDIQWIWFMGDDDYLIGHDVFTDLVKIIKTKISPKVSIIHCCQARRSCETGRVVGGNLVDMCNTIGYHELLGWISSIVVRRDRCMEAFTGEVFNTSKSCYAHSAALLDVSYKDDIVFIDTKWVEPQDTEQTQQSIDRWMKEDIGDGYHYIVDDIKGMFERGKLTKKLNPIFFRYLTYSLWDRYTYYLILDAAQTGTISEKAAGHWQRIIEMADMLANPVDQKLIKMSVLTSVAYIQELLGLEETKEVKTDRLRNIHNNINVGTYPFTNLNNSGTMFQV